MPALAKAGAGRAVAEAMEPRALGVMGAMGHREAAASPEVAFDLDLANCAQDLPALCDRLAQSGVSRAWSLCISGPPGTGKSEFARHLARRLDLPVLQKRASDLLSMFVGGSEKSIAGAFRQAKDLGAVLMIDEAEALLFDRSVAVRGWEVSQVNEMLTWMESHPLPFVCTTNLPERMDHAVPRRFTLKLHFDPLDAAGSALAFRRLLNAEPPRLLPDGPTPGDFAVVRKKAVLFAEHDPAVLLGWLQEEADAKYGKRADIGFRGNQGPRACPRESGGECGPAKHGPDTGPGKRAPVAGPHTSGSDTRQKDGVHRAAASRHARVPGLGLLPAEEVRGPRRRWRDMGSVRGGAARQAGGPARTGPAGRIPGTSVPAPVYPQTGRAPAPTRYSRAGG
jgi:ATPase family associated with various cellular activities (AAA)